MRTPSASARRLLRAVQYEIEERVNSGVSLATLSKQAGLARSTLTRWRSGAVIPQWQEAEKAVSAWGGNLLSKLKGDDPRLAVLFDVYGGDEDVLNNLTEIATDPVTLAKIKEEAKFLASLKKEP